MVKIAFEDNFKTTFSKIKDKLLKNKIIKQLSKIKQNPGIGKPMRYARKGTREVYIKPFRLSYAYLISEEKIIILDLYHHKNPKGFLGCRKQKTVFQHKKKQ